MSRPDLISYQGREARTTLFIRPDLIDKMGPDEDGFALLVLSDGSTVETLDKPYAIAERCKAAGQASPSSPGGQPSSAVALRHLTLESLTIKHPDSDARITMTANREATGIWVESPAVGSASGQSRHAAMYVQKSGDVVIQLAHPAAPGFRAAHGSQLAFSMGREEIPRLQVVSPDGQIRIVDLQDVVEHVARDVVPDPQ